MNDTRTKRLAMVQFVMLVVVCLATAGAVPIPRSETDLFGDLAVASGIDLLGEGTGTQPESVAAESSAERLYLYPLVVESCSQLLKGREQDGLVTYQGDIVLGEVGAVRDVTDDLEAQSQANRVLVAGYGLNGLLRSAYRWPKGIIPYTIDEKLEGRQGTILRAIAEWNRKTNVTLVHYDLERSWIKRHWPSPAVWRLHFVASDKDYSASYVGLRYSNTTGMLRLSQPVWLSAGFCYATVLHEIGHAIGLLHEHNRPDREQFIQVVEANVEREDRAQYAVGSGSIVGEYDLFSIMHYSPRIFAAGAEPTFTVRGTVSDEERRLIGRVSSVSEGDAAAVNAMYPEAAYHPGEFLLPEGQTTGSDGDDVEVDRSPAVADPVIVGVDEALVEQLVRERLPADHPRQLTEVRSIETKPYRLGGLQLVKCTVTFGVPGQSSPTRQYVATLHHGASGLYVMTLK